MKEFFMSPYGRNTHHYFSLVTLNMKEILEKRTSDYFKFDEHDILTSYNAYETEEGIVKIEDGGYYLDGMIIGTAEGEEIGLEPGLFMECYYTSEGLLFEDSDLYYMDDFIDHKLGIVVLQLGGPLILTDYGVSENILLDEPTLESQRISFEKEIEMMSPENTEETPATESPPESPQASETSPPSKPSQPPETSPPPGKDNDMIYYVVPLIAIAFIAVFIVMREKR